MAGGHARRADDYKPTIWAAGAVVYRLRRNKLEILLVHRQRYNDWSLPKGKLDRRESFETCARREVLEETGVAGVIEDALGTVGYVTPAGNNKAVRYWLLRATEESFKPNSEVDKIRWVSPKKAAEKASYGRDVALIRAGALTAKLRTPGTVYLVRHADAGREKKWKKPDDVRPISKKGHEQVEALVTRLVRRPINSIISSPALRCEQTVGPLAQRLGLKVKPSKRLRRDASPTDVMRLIKKSKGTRTVLCSHRETIGPFIESLADDPKVDVSSRLEWPKGSVWELTTRRGRVTKARFIPPG
jgi:8-oxo-dGTP diphosphatase